MKRTHIAAVGVTAALSLALFGWGVVAGAEEVMGIVTGSGDAQIIVSDQPNARGSVKIDKVVAPSGAFVVIHQSDGGMPGKRLGYVRVDRGTSRNLTVKLDPKVSLTPELLAAVHIDRGTKGKLEFDMKNVERSPDKPFFVDGKEVATAFKAAKFGVSVRMDQASIEVADQPLSDSIVVAKVVAPTNAFVVVHRAKPDGMPGERVGYAAIKAGENTNVEVRLTKPIRSRTKLIAAIHADRGVAGQLEFDMEDPVASPDQPFFVDGMEVAAKFEAGPFGVKTADASIKANDQVGALGSIVVSEVDAPAASWIVVHKDADGAPGERVGLLRVPAGTSIDVRVPIEGEGIGERLLVALHADRGTEEKLEFNMSHKLDSADQPYFVYGAEVATAIRVRDFGYPAAIGTAAISVAPQIVSNGLLRVDLAAAPEAAWIVVHLDAGGMPGGRVGLLHIPAGVTRGAWVQLDASRNLSDRLFVAVHADRGGRGVFEFDMMDKVNSPDQPFFTDGVEVATAVSIR